MSSLWMPKKQPLYAPMLGTFGGGSARGFGRGVGAGGGLFDFTSLTFLASTGTSYHDRNQTFENGARVFEESNTISHYTQNYDTVANPWLNDTAYFSLIRAGFQKFTIPADGTYRIRCAGCAGVDNNDNIANGSGRGRGAIIQAEFQFTEGDYIQIVVAKQCNWQGAGGGASFVADSSGNPLVVAGGGGSPWGNTGFANYVDAPNSASGNRAGNNTNYTHNGAGGYQTSGGYGAGAGWYSDNSSSLSNDRQSARLKDDARGGGYKDVTESYQGMFGGGGGAISGGAGYSGGSGGGSPYNQGGGGSFISSSTTGNYIGTISGAALTRTGSEPDTVYTGGGSALGHNTGSYGYVIVTRT